VDLARELSKIVDDPFDILVSILVLVDLARE